ncbi:MAG: LPD1 domain-containing protein [Planctomycetaceae bacterium]
MAAIYPSITRAIARPTAHQAEAGNYRKGHIRIHGLDITIETPQGRSRKPGVYPRMSCHYGYVKRSTGTDGDHVDVFIGPDTSAVLVVVVDQVTKAGKFDEHKCLLGFKSKQAAIDAYRKCYTPAWKVGPVTTMTIDQFKAWLKDGDQSSPIEEQVSKYQAGETEQVTKYSADFDPDKHPRGVDGRFVLVLDRAFFDKMPGKNLREKAYAWAKKTFVDTNRVVTNKQTELPVRFVVEGLKKTANHLPDALPLLCLQVIDKLIQQASYDTFEPSKRDAARSQRKQRQKFAGYHKLKSDVFIDGELYETTISIRVDSNGHAYYDQHVVKKKSEPPYRPLVAPNRDATAAGGSLNTSIGSSDEEVNKMAATMSDLMAEHYASKRDSSNRWITTETGSHILIDSKGTVQAGAGGALNGQKLAPAKPRMVKPRADQPARPPAELPSFLRGRENPNANKSPAVQKFASDVMARIKQFEARGPEHDQPSVKDHPLHHTQLADHLNRALLKWNGAAHAVVRGVGMTAAGADRGGFDVKAAKASAFKEIDPAEITGLLKQLTTLINDAAKEGVNLKPHIRFNDMIPRNLAAKLKPNDSLFRPVKESERYAMAFADAIAEHFAAKHNTQPGQLGLFGSNMGGNVLRRTEKQNKLDFDAKPKPKANDKKLQWITVHPHGGTGHPVLIDKATGTIHGGMGGKFNGKKISDIGHQEPKPPADPAPPEDEAAAKAAEHKKRRDYWNSVPVKDEPKPEPVAEKPKAAAEPAKAPDATNDDFMLESPKDATPRQSAEAKQRELDADYEFARKSAIGNAGQDLKGSARHKVNAWRSLEEAEANGTAAALVTRDQLLKNEPHSIAAYANDNPIVSLLMHESLRAFPPRPGYQKRGGGEKDRADYVGAYRNIRAEAERIASSGEGDPVKASRELGAFVAKEISRLRGMKSNDSIGRATATDRYNNTANALTTLHAKLVDMRRSTSLVRSVGGFAIAIKDKYGAEDIDTLKEKLADAALSVMEGKSMNSVLGVKGEKKDGPKKFSAADLYVAHAERKGGPNVPVATATEATKYMVDKIGLRGVQFGNTVSDKEREHHAKMAAAALVDLADVTGLPLEAISLGGKMGLAMGARGHGCASAHYEAGTQVINLTRKNGVGTLAHEWGHGFDHWLTDFNITRDMDGRSEGDYHSERTARERIVYNIPGDRSSGAKLDGKKLVTEDLTKDPMWIAMENVRTSWRESGFKKRLGEEVSKKVKEGSISKNGQMGRDYWTSGREMFARCFERYVKHKLEKAGRTNTYLSGIDTSRKGGELWPTDAEVEHMAPHFDALMDAHRVHRLKVEDRVTYSALDREFLRNVIADYYAKQSDDGTAATSMHGSITDHYAAKKISQPGQQEFRWITVHPHGGTGHPVMIDKKDGTIKAGMGGKFNGKKIGDVGVGKDNNPAPSQGQERQRPKRQPHDELLQRAAKHTSPGPDYNRNIAAPANRLRNAMERGHSAQMLDHLAGELKARLDHHSPVSKTKSEAAPEAPTAPAPTASDKPTSRTMMDFLSQGKSHADFTEYIKDHWYSDKITEEEWNALHDQMPKITDWHNASNLAGKDVLVQFPHKKDRVAGKVTGAKIKDKRISLEVTDHDGKKHEADPEYTDNLMHRIGHDAKKGRVTAEYLAHPYIQKVLGDLADTMSPKNPLGKVIRDNFGELPMPKRMALHSALGNLYTAKKEAKEAKQAEPSPSRAAAMQKSIARDKAEQPGISMPAKPTNEQARPGDQLGMFGEATRATKAPGKVGVEGKDRQRNLLDGLNSFAGQMSLIDEAGVPEDMIYNGGKGLFTAMHDLIMDHYRAGAGMKPKTKKLEKSKTTTGEFGDTGRYITLEDGRVIFIESKDSVAAKRKKRDDAAKPYEPKTVLDKAIVDYVGSNRKVVEAFKPFVEDAHKMMNQEASETTHALRNVLSAFGHNGKAASAFISNLRHKRDYSGIAGFDEMAEYAAKYHPELLAGRTGESSGVGDKEQAFFNRLRSGFDSGYAKHSPEVLEMASQMAGSSFFDDDNWKEDPHQIEGVPFAASMHDFIMQHYSRPANAMVVN